MIPVAPDPTAARAAQRSCVRQRDVDAHRARRVRGGDTFVVVSASPRFDPATLAAATSDGPVDPIYLELPDDFPEVRRTARRRT